MGESAYSYSLTTFSPSGKLVQIEYALNAVTKAQTSLGIKGARPPSRYRDHAHPSRVSLGHRSRAWRLACSL